MAEKPVKTAENAGKGSKIVDFPGLKTMNALLQRIGLGIRAGLQFGGQRDLYRVFGYKDSPEYLDLIAKYTRQDIASRVVDLPATSTWRKEPVIEGPGVRWQNRWKEMTERLQLWNRFERVDKLCGMGKYAVLFLGYDDGLAPEQPVRRARNLLYTMPYGDGAVRITKFVSDPSNERFGLPEEYTIKVMNPSQLASEDTTGGGATPNVSLGTDVKVHWTRVLHVAESLLENDIFGIPRMLKVYNVLDDILKVSGGSAESYWLTNNRGMQVDVDKEMTMGPEDAENLNDEINEYMHELRRFIRTKGVKINNLGESVTDPQGTFRMLIALISAATGIPQRLLMGSEAGQLASETDRANWAITVSERRNDFAEPVMLRPFIDMTVRAGVLQNPGQYTVKWPEAFILTPLEMDQRRAQFARSVVNLSRQAEKGFPIVTQQEAREALGYEGTIEVPNAGQRSRQNRKGQPNQKSK